MGKIILIIVTSMLVGCSLVGGGEKSSAHKQSSHGAHVPTMCSSVIPIYKNGNLIVSNHTKGFYTRLLIIHNLSHGNIFLNKVITNPGATGGWLSKLGKSNYSALSVNSKRFGITCIDDGVGGTQKLDCAKAIKSYWLPVYANGHSALTGGGFWVAENTNLAMLYQKILDRGYTINNAKENSGK